ncbi:hypothetical protein [Clostridium felsineum]|uniref:Uncharacterized protein n=1 Tax=Clostridium felsineum TaxID=36839 RepID=A0A1S8LWV7_9CLOT|nr:hypothetical protein [Clostridium felsineum]URZ08345.1 hypothetical protein CLROS_037270 [Clostridium felsineum]URZ13376.1 hypothetical protein CROST_041420 [Clostridium felsineum]
MISNFKKRKFIFTVGSIVLIAIVACIGFIKINSLSDKSTKGNKVVVQKKAALVKKTDNKVNKPDNTAVNSQVSDKAVAQNKQVNQPAPIKKSRVVQNELATVNTNKAVQPVKKVVTPPSNPTPPVKKVVTEESNVYVSKNLGIVMTFPESWSGKYSVEETSDYLDIYFNDHKNKGLLLLVERNSPNLSGDGYDPIIDGKYVYRIGDNDYFIAGTTGVTVDDNQPDFKNFMQMHSELPQVINSMRAIK